MSFLPEVRMKVLIRCARICCLCFKQCGTKIEAHHIISEADGAPDAEDNALPICFDCLADVGNYNENHPKGTKYQPKELHARRDALYTLGKSGTLQAQILVHRVPSGIVQSVIKAVEQIFGSISPAQEARDFLNTIFRSSSSLDTLPSKLRLLGPQDLRAAR